MLRSELATSRLILRPVTARHLTDLIRWEADPVLRDLNDECAAPAKAEEVERTVAGWLRPGREDILPYAVHMRTDDRCIGWGMVAAIDRAASECRIGLTIAERDLWGQGLGREVLEALVAHAFGPLGLARIIGEVHAFNTRSIRLLERARFRHLRTERAVVRRGDKMWDELVYARDHA